MSLGRPLAGAESARLAPFIAGAQAAVADWIVAEIFPVAEFAAPAEDFPAGRITACLPLRAATPGEAALPAAPKLFVLMAKPEFTAAFAERAFAETERLADPAAAEPLVADCIAELANLVAGRAKALVYGTPAHFLLGTPSLAPPPPGLYLVAVLAADFGEFELAIC